MKESVAVPYDARVVANDFLKLARRDHIPIFPLKMQKLVYLAHGWNLAFRGEPLIRDEIQAWKYGPVVPNLYHTFKQYGSSAIQAPAPVTNTAIDEESKELIQTVWDRYKQCSDIELSAITHEPGYAWYWTIKNANPWSTPVVKNALIADEFQRRRNQAQHQAPDGNV